MNNRIKWLIEQATTTEKGLPSSDLTYNSTVEHFDKERFAKLIVKECAIIASLFSIEKNPIHPDIAWDDLPESAKMINHTTCQQVAMKIREEFGLQ